MSASPYSQHSLRPARGAIGRDAPAAGSLSSARRAARVIGAFLIALVILSQGIHAPFEKDQEPQSAQWVVDIVSRGHWLLPHDYYDFVERKPPLYYWCAAIVSEAAGRVDEATARAPSLIAGAALAATVLEWTTLEAGEASGWLAFFFLLGIYGFASRATTALTDMLMTFLLFGAWFTIYPLFENVEAVSPTPGVAGDSTRVHEAATGWRASIAGVILGLAVLTKGPVAIVLISLAGLIYLLLQWRNPLAPMRRGWPWVMLAIACAIAAAWYVPAFLAGHSSDLAGVFVAENFGHFLPASMGGTGEAARPVYYIVVRMLGGSLPLSILLPALIIAFAAREFSPEVRKPALFVLAMGLAVIILFSAASAKRDDYILPALPALAVMIAILFTAVGNAKAEAQGKPQPAYAAQVRNLTVGLIASVMAVTVVAAALYFSAGGMVRSWHLGLQSSDASYAALFAHGFGKLTLPFVAAAIAVIIGAMIVLVNLWKQRAIWSGAGLALICLAATSLWTGTLRPEMAQTRSLNVFAQQVKSRVRAAPVYVIYDNPGLAYYYGRAVPSIPRIMRRSPEPPNQSFYLVARGRDLQMLPATIRDHLQVVTVSKVAGGGGPPELFLFQPGNSASGNSTLHSSALSSTLN
jgi:4-amino-4-deoxy-L-arabinose transferase-like glycosyltransferase